MNIEEKLNEEIEWRIFELAIIKTNHLTGNISELRKNIIRKYSVISIYALLEGYIVEALKIYKDEIKLLNLPQNKLNTRIMTYFIDNKYKLSNGKTDFKKKEELVMELQNIFLSHNVDFNVKINTESNANIKVINKLLYSFNLEIIENLDLDMSLNKLLKFRNSLAHGENVLKVTNELICEFGDLVTRLMDLICDRIVDGYKNKTYLR